MPRKLSMTPAAVAKREKYKADKAAKLASLSQPTDTPIETPLDTGAIEVEVTPNEAPKLSLKDRLFGGTAPGAPTKTKTVKKGQRGKQIDASLLAKTFPTIVAATAATYAQRLIHDPYKPCAPTQQEVYSTISPLFSILSRRIEIVGTASEDIIDLISALLAGLVTGIRIHITYLSIQEAKEKVKKNGHINGTGNTPNTSAGDSNGYTRAEGDRSQASFATIGTAFEDTDDGYGSPDFENGDSVDAKPEVKLFAELAKRDRSGRVKLGLI